MAITVLPRTKTGIEAFQEAFTPFIPLIAASRERREDRIDEFTLKIVELDPEISWEDARVRAGRLVDLPSEQAANEFRVTGFNSWDDAKKRNYLKKHKDSEEVQQFLVENSDVLELPGELEITTPEEKGIALRKGLGKVGEKVLETGKGIGGFVKGLTGVSPQAFSPFGIPNLLLQSMQGLEGRKPPKIPFSQFGFQDVQAKEREPLAPPEIVETDRTFEEQLKFRPQGFQPSVEPPPRVPIQEFDLNSVLRKLGLLK